MGTLGSRLQQACPALPCQKSCHECAWKLFWCKGMDVDGTCGLCWVSVWAVTQGCTCPHLEEPFWAHVRLQRWKKDPIEMLVFSSHEANQSNWLMGRSPGKPLWHLIVLENHINGRKLLLTPCIPACSALQPLLGGCSAVCGHP